MIIRDQVSEQDSWNLDPLYSNLADWKKDFSLVEQQLEKVSDHRGTLGLGVAKLGEAIELYLQMNRVLEKVYVYTHLRSDQDTGNSENLGRHDQAVNLAARVGEAWSFFTPELLELSDDKIQEYLTAEPLREYRRLLREVLRYKPHTLSQQEEQILAAGAEIFGSCDKIFSQLNNADLTFPPVRVKGEDVDLSHGTYTLFLKNEDREVRAEAFKNYYSAFDSHKNTIAATLAGSIKKNIYLAKTKRYHSSREASLFSDDVPVSVYDNLIETVSNNLAPLHRYYEVRKKLLAIPSLRIYDTYVPLVSDVHVRHSYEEAANLVLKSVQPLGKEYATVLKGGLLADRWVDRFENKGKRSGAYSSGCFDSPPYILMNYKEDSFNDVFTLAHEAGHSMHTYFSSKHQPYQDHNYTIFVAEVASTLNEQLLCHHLENVFASDERMLAYLINHQIDDIKSTLYRQTMFAEFEKMTHALAEEHEPLTVEALRDIYGKLLHKYFGPAVTVDALDELECLRIPHFYSAFYVYKYATGISAAIALSEQLLGGGEADQTRYLQFLKSGGSKYPLELLRDAGVDMAKPQPVESALRVFSSLVDKLDQVLNKLKAGKA